MADSAGLIIRFAPWRVLIAVSIGNALEWFDFVIYGYFAGTISRHFFTIENSTVSLLLALGIYGAAFVVRPVGAIVIGNYADRYGRKPALTLTISLMTAGTAIIAFTPTFQSIGLVAPVLIVCARILQGFSAGGEFGSATALLAELYAKRRGFFASWQFASQALTGTIATATGTLLSRMLSYEQLDSWGWRLPFIFGLLIGPVAYYIRRRIAESLEFQSAKPHEGPLREVLAGAKQRLIIAIGTVAVPTTVTYTLIFMPTFAVRQLGLPLNAAFEVGLITSITQMLLVPIAGALSDRWGRLPGSFISVIGIMLITYPLFVALLEAPSFETLLAFQFCVGALLAGYMGALPALMSELFPTSVRSSGLSISYSCSVAIFGGFAPFINASLISWTGSNLIPCFYMTAGAVISLVALFGVRRLGIQ